MAGLKYHAYRTAFEILSLSGVSPLIRRFSQCCGVIFTLHRVLPEPPAQFSPNAILQITPEFLDAVIAGVRQIGMEIVTLDEGLRRLRSPIEERLFVVLTFDDGYRDNLEHALPVLERHDAPFTIYIPTAYIDGAGRVWWQALEDIIRTHSSIEADTGGGAGRIATDTIKAKHAAYDRLYARMRALREPDREHMMSDLALQAGYDLDAQCRDLIMGWDELRDLSRNPLCTVGAHTVHHYELAKLSETDAREEITGSIDRLESELGERPRHLSYPIGGRASAGAREYELALQAGVASAVTTLPGGLYPHSTSEITALPRISLNGLFQERRFVDVFATGAIFSIAR